MIYYTQVLWGEMNGRLGKAKFNSLMILRYSIASCKNILGNIYGNFETKLPSKSFGFNKEADSTIPI